MMHNIIKHKINNNKSIIDNNAMNIKIQKITQIYQDKFFNGDSTGLGDFIRVSIFILQYCKLYNIECDISLKNHNLYKFLNNSTPSDIIRNDVSIIQNKDLNCKMFDVRNDTIKCISYPPTESIQLFNKYLISIYNNNNHLKINTIFFPLSDTILLEHKEYIKKVFEPKEYIKIIVHKELIKMNLIKQKYKIIHIRCGDKELINNIIDDTIHNKIINKINNYIQDNSVLIISDSNAIKEKIKLKYPKVSIYKNNISHIGEGVKNSDNNYISLLIDFLFISFSNEVVSFSTLHHGSGFSEWTSKIYDIPYKCYFIE